METLARDLKHAVRSFGKTPAFTATALAALALGIGANAAIFSVINAVLLKPLSYPDPDRIVQFMLSTPAGPGVGASETTFNVWRRQTAAFNDVCGYNAGGLGINLTVGAYAEQVQGARVTADCFRLFGAPIAKGRGFREGEDRPGAEHVAVLSNGFWKQRFAGDPGMLGKAISLNGKPYTIVGILGPGFDFDTTPPPDIWLPFEIDPDSVSQAHSFVAAARLKPGVTLEMANAQLQLASVEFRRQFPSVNTGLPDGFSVMRLQDRFVGDVRPSLMVLACAVGLVLLIACANVANLLLVRATGRKREIAIRAAVGAGRGHLIRQLLTESMALSATGGALGLALGVAGTRALLAINPGDVPRIGEHASAVTVDWRVLLFTGLVSMATGVVFGLIPALGASRTDLGVALQESGNRSGPGPRQNRTRALLVAGEVALALVLLVGAALLVRTFVALRTVDAGFDPHNVLTMRMLLAGSRFRTTAEVAQLVRDGVERIDSLPGATAASGSTAVPLEGQSGLPIGIVGRPMPASGSLGRVGWIAISPGYFAVFRIPLVRGRLFSDRDGVNSAGVVIVNQALARKFWPEGDPLNDRLLIAKGYGKEFEEPARQIVGIVGDVRADGLNLDPEPMAFVPLAQLSDGFTALIMRLSTLAWEVRTRVPPHSVESAIENELRRASGGLPLARIRSMDEVVARSTARARFNMTLLIIFSAAALLLASVGIYGSISYSLEQRRREMGIRIALGADAIRLQGMVLAQGLRLALAGVAAGLAGAFVVSRAIASFLFGVKTWDPLVFVTAPILLIAVALLAVWLPARRITRIDPVIALRSE